MIWFPFPWDIWFTPFVIFVFISFLMIIFLRRLSFNVEVDFISFIFRVLVRFLRAILIGFIVFISIGKGWWLRGCGLFDRWNGGFTLFGSAWSFCFFAICLYLSIGCYSQCLIVVIKLAHLQLEKSNDYVFH